MKEIKKFIFKNKIELIFFSIALIFSTWLMFSTFSYSNSEIQIATKAWSDFASHIPLIRSFSLGSNFPPEYPLFAGPHIKYHFLFYAFAGLLEKMGLRIDYALNIPSILGFTFLIMIIYLLAKDIFKSKAVGVLSAIFFLFNGSLSFINFFKKYQLSLNSINDIVNNNYFVNFGPYDGSIISAFWNLNIYTNQRHLAISYALSLFIIYFLLKKSSKGKFNIVDLVFISTLLGFSFILNMAVFLITSIILLLILIGFPHVRKFIFTILIISSLIALPQYLYFQSETSTYSITLKFGYLVEKLDLINFLNYWINNIGLHIILIPLGIFLAHKSQKKLFICIFSIFIIANTFQFSPEIAANHKFINYFMMFGVMYSAYALIKIWNKNMLLKPLVIVIIFFLTFSGILDFFPVFNDKKIYLKDIPENQDATWIKNNTNPKSIFLNTSYLYNAASIAGRKIFLGWPYFAWSQGYNTTKRDNELKEFFLLTDKKLICDYLNLNNISYIYLENNDPAYKYNQDYWNNFYFIYENAILHTKIIEKNSLCL